MALVPRPPNIRNLPTFNLDIWHEVVRYFDSSGQDKKTLRSLALSSLSLSNIALPALWRERTSLTDLVSVINAFTTPDDKYLVYGRSTDDTDTEGEQPYWLVRKRLPDEVRSRARKYLSYVRRFKTGIYLNHSKGLALWPVLSACLNCEGPLMPALISLEIRWHELVDHLVSSLVPLLSPSITSLDLDCEDWPACKLAPAIINLVGSRVKNLQRLSYNGESFCDLHSTLASFSNVQVLEIYNLPISPPLPQRLSSISSLDFLSSFPNLTDLHWDMDVFPPCQRLPGLGPVYHNGLRTLTLTGNRTQIVDFFSSVFLPSLFKLSVWFIEADEAVGWRHFHELLVSGCPRLGDYSAEQDNSNCVLSFYGISPLFSLPLQKFRFYSDISFTLQDVHKLANSWPRLNTLLITRSPVYDVLYDALKLLSLLSHHTALRHLSVRLDVWALLSPNAFSALPPLTPVQNQSCPSLESLGLLEEDMLWYGDGNDNLRMENLARNILHLFPKLSKLTHSGGWVVSKIDKIMLTLKEDMAKEC